MAKYRAVILGCGGRSEWHARAYDLVDGAEVVACCDLLEEPRTRFAARFGLRGYANLEEMIEKEKPDLIHLVTRPSTRVEQLTLVSEMGVPACIVEKPIALGCATGAHSAHSRRRRRPGSPSVPSGAIPGPGALPARTRIWLDGAAARG